MSQIHIADGQNDNILDYITAKNIISDTHKKSLENTLETYNFITFADKSFSAFLEKRNRIIIPDEDDSLVEFVIFEAHKYRDREGHKAQVYAHASYLELKKASIIYPGTFTGTASQHGGRALNGTGWEIGIVESDRTITIEFDNHTNPYEYLKRIAKEFELELDFKVEHNGTKITRRIVDLVERIGVWRGREITFGKDLDGIRRVEKQDIVTALLGIAPEDENGNRLEVLVEDEEALQRWGRRDEHGNLQHLIEPYVIQSDRSEMTETEARQYTRTALDKRINTQITYETTIVDLENVPGMANKKIRFGDTIKIKDEKFNPPLYLEARVFEQDRSIKSKGKKNIKLGDFIEYTEEEVNNVYEQLKKEIRARITRSEMVEHTYSKVEIDQKDEYIFDEGKTFAEAVGITAEDNAKQFAIEQDSALKIDVEDYADQVADQAESNAKSYAEDKSSEALQQALAESVSKDVYNQKMAEIASDLSEKAGIAYVDGKLQIVDGRLDDLDAEIETKADGSTVYTISEVDNMINNTVSLTQYTTDMDGIVTDLSDQSTQIGQNTEAIGLKADNTRVDTLAGTIDDHSAELLTMADEISAKVEADYVQTAIDESDYRNYFVIANAPSLNSSGGGWNAYSHGLNIEVTEDIVIGSVLVRASSAGSMSISLRKGTTSGGVIETKDFEVLEGDNRLFLNWKLNKEQGTYGILAPDSRDVQLFRTGPIQDSPHYPYESGSFKIVGSTSSSYYYFFYDIEIAGKGVEGESIIGGVEAEISSLSSELSVQAGKINAKADSTTVTALGVRTTSVEQSLDAIEGQIVNKVEVDDVRSIFTQEASQFTFDASQVNFTGHIFGQGATFGGTVEGGRLITGDVEIGGGEITIGKPGTLYESWSKLRDGNIYAYLDPSPVGGTSVGGEISWTPKWVSDHSPPTVGVDWDISTRHGNINLIPSNGVASVMGNEIEAVVSQGSNSSGHWIRYSSGVQICWITLMSGTGGLQSSGSIYRSDAQTWTFPQPFSSSPAISGSVRATGRWLSSGVTSDTSANIVQYGSVSSSSLYSMDVIAIGRWK